MSSPRPTATGSLDSTPLLNLLVYAVDHQLTGTLVLEEQPGGYKHAIYFAEGVPSRVKTAQAHELLSAVLIELGHLDADTAERTFAEAQANGVLHGRWLLSEQYLDEPKLRAGLREQLARKLVFLAGRPSDTLYGYYDQVNLLERWGAVDGPRARPLDVIWRVAQARREPERIEAMLQRLAGRVLKLHVDAPIQRFGFARQEQVVIDVLRAKPQPFEELVARELAPRELVAGLVYVLSVTRQFDLGGGPSLLPLGVDEPPSSTRLTAPVYAAAADFGAPKLPGDPAPRSFSPIPGAAPQPPPLAPELLAFRAEIVSRAEANDETHYQLLGVEKESTASEVQSAFLALAKKWHPDRISPDLVDVREFASRVFSRMNEASQVLQDPVQRREYDSKLRRAGREAEEAEHVARVLRASGAFQRAEVHMKRNNLAAAEIEARQAFADDPDQADHIALLAWLEAQKSPENVDAAIKELDRALGMQPKNARAHWYRGQLYKRVGRMRRAMSDFRHVLENDPRNLDAQREIRLYNMRRGDRPTSIPPSGGDSNRPTPSPATAEKPKTGEGGGFISKLFKR